MGSIEDKDIVRRIYQALQTSKSACWGITVR